MLPPVLIAAGVMLFGVLAFDMMGVLVRMLGGTYPILQIAVLRNLFGVLPCLLYTSPSPRDLSTSRMPSSA